MGKCNLINLIGIIWTQHVVLKRIVKEIYHKNFHFYRARLSSKKIRNLAVTYPLFLFRICKNYIGVIYMVHCKDIYCQSISIAKKVSYFCSCKSKEEYTIFQTWYNVMTKNLHINTQGSYWEWNITVSNLIVYDPVYTKKISERFGYNEVTYINKIMKTS